MKLAYATYSSLINKENHTNKTVKVKLLLLPVKMRDPSGKSSATFTLYSRDWKTGGCFLPID
jgi:hypothetical protein